MAWEEELSHMRFFFSPDSSSHILVPENYQITSFSSHSESSTNHSCTIKTQFVPFFLFNDQIQSQIELAQNINRIQSSVLAVFKDSLPGLFQSRPAGPDGSETFKRQELIRRKRQSAKTNVFDCRTAEARVLLLSSFLAFTAPKSDCFFYGCMEGKLRNRSNNEGS